MKVEILFPEVGNLCGDLMNIRYLRQCCPELEVLETDLKSRPAFLEGGVDLVYMGSATEKGLELMVKAPMSRAPRSMPLGTNKRPMRM